MYGGVKYKGAHKTNNTTQKNDRPRVETACNNQLLHVGEGCQVTKIHNGKYVVQLTDDFIKQPSDTTREYVLGISLQKSLMGWKISRCISINLWGQIESHQS